MTPVPKPGVAVIKTWPAFMDPEKVADIFSHPWENFFFTLGRGKPRIQPERIYFTHRSKIVGSFRILEIVQNAGQLPKLRSLSGETSEWQIKKDMWVAVCDDYRALSEKIFCLGFRGWRYFDLELYRGSLDAKVRL